MGMDHEQLTFFYAGMNQRLTGVRGEVIGEVMACGCPYRFSLL